MLITASFSIFMVIENDTINDRRQSLLTRENTMIDVTSENMSVEIDLFLSDLYYLKSLYETRLTLGNHMDEISKEWKIFSESRGNYDQIRYIDKNGEEIIKISYSDNKSYIIPESGLQMKKDKYYFNRTRGIGQNQVYISSIDFNIEDNDIEHSLIRISAPLYDANNEFAGLIILNYLAENILYQFENIKLLSRGQLFLLNSDGYYLSTDYPDQSNNLIYEDTKPMHFSNYFPIEWKTIKNQDGHLFSDNGLLAFSRINLTDRLTNGDPYMSKENLVFEEDSWIIGSYISTNSTLGYFVANNKSDIIKKILSDHNFDLLLMGLLAMFISLFLNKRITYLMNIKFLSDYDPMTNTFNRRAGCLLLNDKIKISKYNNNYKLTICFIDVNGLKYVNDNLGHGLGDQLLSTVVQVIKKHIRKDDFIIRMGGDEFLIIFEDIGEVQAEEIWWRIVSSFEAINQHESRDYTISVSHGILEFDPSLGDSSEDFVSKADAKMYEEKRKMKENDQ